MKTSPDVRTCHDEWSKRALALWLKELGDVVLDARIAGESRRGDVLFTERRTRAAYRRKLGTLGDLAHGRVLFEPFRNPLTVLELKSCVLKAVDLEARDARTARRARLPLSTVEGTALCVITPTMSADFAAEASTTPLPGNVPGLYTLARMWSTVIVVVHELPENESTLWLRLFGRGKVQARAVQEFEEMSRRGPLGDATLQLLVAWRQSLPQPSERSDEEEELAMNLERVYERWERKVKAEGKLEGKAEGKAEGKIEGRVGALLAVLEGRGLAVTASQRKQMLACTDAAQLDAWLHAAGTASSVKELLASPAPRRARPSSKAKASRS
ncbi:MAG: hypothetical protein ACMG6S_01530 [Byssovorax sp.]